MSRPPHVRINYRTEVTEDRRLCSIDAATVYVNLYRQVATTERRPDGSTVVTEGREQLVQSWTYRHEVGE